MDRAVDGEQANRPVRHPRRQHIIFNHIQSVLLRGMNRIRILSLQTTRRNCKDVYSIYVGACLFLVPLVLLAGLAVFAALAGGAIAKAQIAEQVEARKEHEERAIAKHGKGKGGKAEAVGARLILNERIVGEHKRRDELDNLAAREELLSYGVCERAGKRLAREE